MIYTDKSLNDFTVSQHFHAVIKHCVLVLLYKESRRKTKHVLQY